MSLNCSEIDLILNELNLAGTFIQEIVQPSYDTLALYTYRPGEPKTVFISLTPGSCRIHEVRRKIPKNEKPLRFNEILRSRIKGGRITECVQLEKNRIIKIRIKKDSPILVMPPAKEKFAGKKKEISEQEEDEFYLYIRLWSNAGNIFLCSSKNIILDSFYRRPNKNETTGQVLQLPEKNAELSDEEIQKKFPPRTFSEIENGTESEKSLTYNEKVDIYYSRNIAANSLASLLEQAEKWYNSHHSRQSAALARLEEKKSAFQNAEQWKHQGDLILTNAHLLKNTDSSGFLEVEDYESGKTVCIKINPSKTPQENAWEYYEIYKKQKNGLSQLEQDISHAKKALEELDEKYAKLIQEKNPVKLEQVLRKIQKPRQQEKDDRPGLSYTVKDWTIFVGRDSSENDELLRHYVKGNDMWFHTRDFPGGYVFVKSRTGKTIPLEIMLLAGNLALYHSKGRKNGQADLYYTQVKYLRRAKNGPKGLVLPTNEKNLHIKLDTSILKSLDN